jgi:hypothetical protein
VRAEDIEKTLTLLLVGGFDMLSQRLGPEWALDPGNDAEYPEAKKVSEPAARIIDRLGGSAIGKYGDWIALAGGIAMLVGPRVYLHLQKAPKRPATKPEQPAARTQPPAPDGGVTKAGSGVLESVAGVVGS